MPAINKSVPHSTQEHPPKTTPPTLPPPSTEAPPKPLLSPSIPVIQQPKPTLPAEEKLDPLPPVDVIINWEIFDQLLGLDDEDDDARAFSKGTVQDYFAQATQKFQKMDEALEKGFLEKVTDEAHSLKGSSAAIALSQVEATFGEIDRFREKAKAWEGKENLSEEDAREKIKATEKIKDLLRRAKKENSAGKGWMEKWYEKETGTRESF